MAMRIDPPLANLHGERRYRELLVRLGLAAGLPGVPPPHAAR